MIKVSNLTKNFGGFRALDGVTLHVERGSIYGLIGPNGAGKTTLIRHLAGVYRPDSGEILIDGQPVYENPAIKSKISYIPDSLFFFLNDTVTDMMHFYRRLYPSFSTERYERLREAFPSIDERCSLRRLSKGMQKQVAFWLAVSCMPEIILLDEPVDGLDPIMRRQVWSLLMADVAEHGTTVLISSHNLRELEDVCDSVGIMDHGQFRLERNLTDLQGEICKIQAVFEDTLPVFPAGEEPLHISSIGRVYTLILRKPPEEALEMLAPYHPIMADALPLTLEEIFIYELGGAEHGVREIVL